MDKIVIIGYGKLGSHLYFGLKNKAKTIGVIKNSNSLYDSRVIKKSSVIIICTQDSGINTAVKRLISANECFRGKYVFHTSGSLDSVELKPLKKTGALFDTFQISSIFL